MQLSSFGVCTRSGSIPTNLMSVREAELPYSKYKRSRRAERLELIVSWIDIPHRENVWNIWRCEYLFRFDAQNGVINIDR